MWTGSSSRFRGRAFQSNNLRKSFSEDTDGLDILDGMMDRLLPKPHTMHRMQYCRIVVPSSIKLVLCPRTITPRLRSFLIVRLLFLAEVKLGAPLSSFLEEAVYKRSI